MRLSLFLPPVGVAVALSWPSVASAEPIGPARFCEAYPDTSFCAPSPPACTLCHESTDAMMPTWNAYGLDVADQLAPGSFEDVIVDAILDAGPLDSDGDGFTNDEEIDLGTDPADDGSSPADLGCPESTEELSYDVCSYDREFVFRKVRLDFCGVSPTFEELEAFRALSADDQETKLDTDLDACLMTEFWRGRQGVLWQLAFPKVRPVAALKSGKDRDVEGIAVADYYNDIILWVWAQIDDHDARDVLLADYYVQQDGTDFYTVDEIGLSSGTACTTDADCLPNEQCGTEDEPDICICDGACLEAVDQDYRYGLLTTRWVALYSTMFTAIPRATAAQAYRAFLGLDIAKQEGLQPVDQELIDYDDKGITDAECIVCHSTLDWLAYPFTVYQGFGPNRAHYFPGRMTSGQFSAEGPLIEETPQAGVLLGQTVNDLGDWAQVAADSDEFATASVGDYWQLLMGRPPVAAETEEFAELWMAFRGEHQYSVRRMLHDFIRTEAYGAP